MVSQSELGQEIGKGFVAQTLDGRVAEVKVVKVHEGQGAYLENISERIGGYRALSNVSQSLGFLELGIVVEGITFGNHQTSIPEIAILTVGAFGIGGAIMYFQERIKDFERKIDQIKKNRLPTISG